MSCAQGISEGVQTAYVATAQCVSAAIRFTKPKCEKAMQIAKNIILTESDSPSMKKMKIGAAVLLAVGAFSLLTGKFVAIGVICLIFAAIFGAMAKKGIEPEQGVAMVKEGISRLVARFSQQQLVRQMPLAEQKPEVELRSPPGGPPLPRYAHVEDPVLHRFNDAEEGIKQVRHVYAQGQQFVGALRDLWESKAKKT